MRRFSDIENKIDEKLEHSFPATVNSKENLLFVEGDGYIALKQKSIMTEKDNLVVVQREWIPELIKLLKKSKI